MSEWKEYKLNDLVTKLGDGLHGTPKYDPKGDYYFINGSNLLDGKISVNENTKRVSKEEFDKYKKELSDRTIFVSINGTLGNIATYNNEKVILGKSACYFNVKDDVCKEFIKYIATDKSFQYYISEYATGSTIKNVPLKAIRDYTLKLPDLPTQNAIAEILSSLDDKIELNNKINQELELLAQTLFKKWFIDFEFPNENGEPYKSYDGEMVDSELGEIPMGWKVKTLDDVSNITIGRTPPRQEYQWFSKDVNDVKWISIRDMGNCGTYIHSTSEYLTEEAVRHFNVPVINSNTVIISFKLTVGRISITTERMLSNEAIAHLNLKDSEIYPEFLYLFLKQFNFDSLGSTSSIATAVNSKAIKSLPFIYPSKEILSRFKEVLVPIFSRIHNLTFENKEIVSLRDEMLPKLITGELEINEITN